MSCLIMNPEPLAAMANAIEARLNQKYDFWGFEVSDDLPRAFSDCKISGIYFAKFIYRKLYALNVKAYNSRYPNHEAPESEVPPDIDVNQYAVHHGPEYREHSLAVCPWHYQLAKLLDFWLYQTLEDATCNDPLRLAVTNFRDNLYAFIIQNSPEYTKLTWGKLT